MSLKIYNTLTNEKELFVPIHPGKVGIYLCGPTVYKESHIGHAVGPVIFDAFKRFLCYKGFKVMLIVNITDVDDKIIDQAAAENCNVRELAERITRQYLDAMAQLGVTGIDQMPKASEHIPDIINLIERLINKGSAYVSGGDVYFDVMRFESYGKLSNRKMEDQTGRREVLGQGKRHPNDFALWKSAKPTEPAEVGFDSPWGRGRPGWHIECSAMSMKYLGDTFDIHGGGMDLIFPHHENEIAQSECCTGKNFAKYWMHNGLTRFNTKKVSKSDPEMQRAMEKMTLSHLLNTYGGEMLRFFILSTHYRRPIEFSDTEMESKQKSLNGFYRLFDRLERLTSHSPYDEKQPTLHKPQVEIYPEKHHAFIQDILVMRNEYLDMLDDDFNTAGAIGTLFKYSNSINRFLDQNQAETIQDETVRFLALSAARSLVEDARVLGLFVEKPPKTSDHAPDHLREDLIGLLVRLRADAKKDKNFALADRIRNELSTLGISLVDHPGGTQWTFADR